jgi:tripartite-type tricarboxylate transporter receptor subunit TctC
LARSADIPFTIVSYNGNGQLLQDLMGGRLDGAMVDYTASSQFVEAGKLKLIGITNDVRDPRHPKLPTLGESVPGYQALGWFGFVVAAGTPEPIVKTLNEAMNKAIAEPDVQETLLTFGLIPAPGSPSDLAARMKAEDRRYGELVRKINFQRQ